MYTLLGFQEKTIQSQPFFKLFFGNKSYSESSIFFHSLVIEFL